MITLLANGNERFDLWAPEAGTVTLLADGRHYPMTRRTGVGDGSDAGTDGGWTAPEAPASGDVD